jgi:glycylpeptide N-tetradecanoyltransferase
VVTDFVSFYALNSSIMGHPRHDSLRAAYLYYYFVKNNDKSRLEKLVHDALVYAKDVTDCLI